MGGRVDRESVCVLSRWRRKDAWWAMLERCRRKVEDERVVKQLKKAQRRERDVAGKRTETQIADVYGRTKSAKARQRAVLCLTAPLQ